MSLEKLCPVHRGHIAMSGSSGVAQVWESLNPTRHLQNIAKKV